MSYRHFEFACSLGRLSLDGMHEFLSKDPEHIARFAAKPTLDFVAACKARIRRLHPRLRAFRVLECEGRHIVAITRA
jgi:hypothetical protein